MNRYTFAVNRVSDTGAHEHQEGKTIQVDATDETLARSIAREKLKDWSPGVQRFQAAELVAPPEELKPTDPAPEADPSQEALVVEPDAAEAAAAALAGKKKETIQ